MRHPARTTVSLLLAVLALCSSLPSGGRGALAAAEETDTPTPTPFFDDDNATKAEGVGSPAENGGGGADGDAGANGGDGGGGEDNEGRFVSALTTLIPEECYTVIQQWSACLIQNQMDCIGCITGEGAPDLSAESLPETCDDLSGPVCFLSRCCEPCAQFGGGMVECYNAEGGRAPDGEECEILCGVGAQGNAGGGGSGAIAQSGGGAVAFAAAAAAVGAAWGAV